MSRGVENSASNAGPLTDNGILLAWYGDDFTGAAAAMEVLTFAGLKSVLFLEEPTPAHLARFPGLTCIGLASTARAEPPDWMRANLPGIFARLAALKPQILHYKVCSTLDSSPEVGSIGQAMEIGADHFGASLVPVVVAAPQMRRFQFHGHLFAGAGDAVVRLDRHPVMARHPVTPMTESDVALHISRQSRRIDPALLSLDDLSRTGGGVPSPPPNPGRITALAIDVIDTETEAAAGRAVWESRAQSPFVVGSQGVEYALVAHWRRTGLLAETAPPGSIGAAARMISVSGSVSPTTADQIAWSKAHGFAPITFDATQACGGAEALEAEVGRVTLAALGALSQGLDPLVHTAEGPDDPAVARLHAAVEASGRTMAGANQAIGAALGRMLHAVLARTNTRRAVVSGGDTSGFATRQLGVFALSALAPTIPGASISQAHADGPIDGLELALKGGQMGSPDYFGWVRDGGGARE